MQIFTTTHGIMYDIDNANNPLAFQLWVRARYINGAENLNFNISAYNCHNIKLQMYQELDVDIVPPVCNFIKNETLAYMLSCEFC